MNDAAGSTGGLAPEAEDVEDIVAAAGRWDLQVSAAFGGFEEVAFLLSQPVPHCTAANAGTGRESSAEFLNVILSRAVHGKGYAGLRDKDVGCGGADSLRRRRGQDITIGVELGEIRLLRLSSFSSSGAGF